MAELLSIVDVAVATESLVLKEENNFILLSPDFIDFNKLINWVRTSKSGSVSSFLGTTRDSFEDKVVTELSYEAFEEMAILELNRICDTARGKWALHKIAIQHKLGACPIGEISVAIAVSSEHRTDSLESVNYIINELKATVPIWKKEFYAEGSGTWKKNVEFSESFVKKNVT